MKIEIKIPAMGESISQATIGEIFKPSGSTVSQDEELLEIETDKVNQPLYAAQGGELTLSVKTGDTVAIGTVIGTIDTSKKGEAKEKKPSEPNEVAPSPKSPESKEAAPSAIPPEPKEEVPSAKPSEVKKTAPASPSEVPIRHMKEDFVKELQEKPTAKETLPPKNLEKSSGASVTRKPMSKLRKVIAKRLVEVKQQTAMLTTFNEADMESIIQIRETHKDQFLKKNKVKLGFMSFFVKAVARALKAFPEVYAYIDGDDIVYRNTIDISIAVSTEKGVIVPTLRQADTLSFVDIETIIASLAVKARDGTLTMDDLQGGGFTITNGGVFGSLLSTPILNPPQSAILGMHTIQKRPVVINDQIVIRPMMYLALSYDHRIIDGKEAVSFLVAIKNALEDPSLLLIDF